MKDCYILICSTIRDGSINYFIGSVYASEYEAKQARDDLQRTEKDIDSVWFITKRDLYL